MSLREFFQQHYLHELERKDQINNALVIPLGVVSVVSGALVVVAKEIDNPFDNAEMFQLVFMSLTAFSIILAAIFLARSYWGYGYGHIPRAGEIRKYRDDLSDYFMSSGKTKEEALTQADEETMDYVHLEYASNAEMNAENNDKKSANLFKANGFTILSVGFLVVSAVPYVINSINQPTEIQKTEIVNIKELKMTTTPTNQNQGQQQPAPKPSPPPSRVIREHVEPKKK